MKNYLAILAFFLCGCGEDEARFESPSKASVNRIEIDLTNFPPIWKGREEFKFRVPESDHEKILELFDEAHVNVDPHSMEYMGTVEIEGDAQALEIQVFSDSQGHFEFKKGNSYYTGESIDIALEVIQTIHAKWSEQDGNR